MAENNSSPCQAGHTRGQTEIYKGNSKRSSMGFRNESRKKKIMSFPLGKKKSYRMIPPGGQSKNCGSEALTRGL